MASNTGTELPCASSKETCSSFSDKSRRSDHKMNYGERALSAAGAAVLSAILVNPLDVAKTRLQAQAAGFPYSCSQHHIHQMASLGTDLVFSDFHCADSCARGCIMRALHHPDCLRYKGTVDVIYKIIRQEGFLRLWRGTNAGLVLAVPTVGIYLPFYDVFVNYIETFTKDNASCLTTYSPLIAGSVARSLACIVCSPIEMARTRMQAHKEIHNGIKPPGMWKTLVEVLSSVRDSKYLNVNSCRLLWTGVGAQLARDVPFSAICWSTLEPTRRRLLNAVGKDANAASIVGANFTAGFVAGCLAAATTCPLDVAKTRRQIEKDPSRALKMTTRKTLLEIWRDGGIKGMFMGVGPRIGRAGPSVGIVVSFYELVKHLLYQRHVGA